MKNIKWEVSGVLLKSKEERSRRDDFTGEVIKYSIFRIVPEKGFSRKSNEQKKGRKEKNEVGILCFKAFLHHLIEPGDSLKMEGTVNFGYGNTYLVVEKIWDKLGIKIGSGESLRE